MLIQDKTIFSKAVEEIKNAPLVVLDIETDGLEIWVDKELCGIGVCLPYLENKTYYFPFRHKEKELPLLSHLLGELNLPIELLPILLKALKNVPTLLGHNIKFDLAGLYKEGYRVPDSQKLEDTLIGARLFFHDKFDSLSLENLTKTILGIDESNWKHTFKKYLKSNKIKSYDWADVSLIAEYCERDTLNTYLSYQFLMRYVKETDQGKIYEQESTLLKIIFEMECTGLYFDRNYCVDRLAKLKHKIQTLSTDIYAVAGKEFDVNSVKQLNEVLTQLGIESKGKTATGNAKWGVSELMSIGHPISGLILELRGIEKMRSTYFEPILVNKDDRLHPNIKSWGTITGRMATTNPSVQNLSNKSQNLSYEEQDEEVLDAIKAMLGARQGQYVDMTSASGNIAGGGSLASLTSYAKKYEDTDDSVAVRRLYVPPAGYKLYCIDYSQMEMRVFADYVQDPHLHEYLEDRQFDFHSHVATEVWNVTEDSGLWKFYRNLAKAINFGLIYGIGDEKLASQIQKTVDEAKEYKKQYFARFPKALGFIESVRNVVTSRGWVKNRFGRRYYISSEKAYTGVNYLVQGTSADIVKNRMIAIADYNSDKQSKMVIQIHDELLFYVHESEEKLVVPEYKRLLEDRQIKTYLPVEVSLAEPSWAQKKKICLTCFKEPCTCDQIKTNIG